MRNYPQLSPDQQLLHVFCDLYPWLDQVTVVLDGQTNADYVETFQPKNGVLVLLDFDGVCVPFDVPYSILAQVQDIAEWIGTDPFWGKKLAKKLGYSKSPSQALS